MQRSISSNVFVTGTPAFCGKPPMARNFFGSIFTCSASASFTAWQYQWTIFSGFAECIIVYGRGEIKAKSVPTSSRTSECL